ncbi:hypothetical protein ABEG72_23100 [Pantoea agglomerans]|uniref:hypothetical protein n=1 Tax=Enterobacter agglomerans TaxID=549 RepID=UPI0032085C8C
MDVLRNYSTTYNGQHVDNNATGLMNQISSGITTSDSKYAQYTASQSHTHELQKMASETETLSAGARDNYTQQFVEWAQKRSPGNAETILTNTSDEGVQKQRDGLVQKFFAEKLQGRIDGNYARNSGSTGEGMGAPANTAGAQFGGAYDSANQNIDAGVARNNIRTGVINDVEEQQAVVNNKANDANATIEKAKGETDSGIASRMGEYTSSANNFADDKRAADKQQDDLLVNPFKNYTHKDYKGDGKE